MSDPKSKNSTEGHAAEKQTAGSEGLLGFASIPATDSEAALKFCRGLAGILAKRPCLPITDEI